MSAVREKCLLCDSKTLLLVDPKTKRIKGWFCPECKDYHIYKSAKKVCGECGNNGVYEITVDGELKHLCPTCLAILRAQPRSREGGGVVILAIDPGNKESAYVLLDKQLKPVNFGKIDNQELLSKMSFLFLQADVLVIEMVASYGMAVGAEVFETVFWIGRFWEKWTAGRHKVYRKDVKMNLCNSMKAKDSNIRQALIDRFGVVGTKKNPGWFYGVSKDVWSAVAVGVTFADMQRIREVG